MTSQNRQKGTYVYDSTDAPSTVYEAAKQRHATVYDAVAGRVSLKFSKDAAAATASSSRKTSSGHHQLADPVLAPEEVLFSRTNAPQRYAEKDMYFAHEDLSDGGRGALPDSDLVKALHGYASHFYEAMGQRHDREGRGNTARADERSMDETALLAAGILLEEAVRESLGRNGDVVFTEGVRELGSGHGDEHDDDGDDDDVGDEEGESTSARRRKGATTSPRSRSSYAPVGFEDEPGFWRRKYSSKKRRKTEHHQEE